MVLEETNLPSKVTFGSVVQEFDPSTGQFVRQFFKPDGPPQYKAPDGQPVGRDMFLDHDGNEVGFVFDMRQPIPDVQVIDLGRWGKIEAHRDGTLKSKGILESEASIQEQIEPDERAKATLCNTALQAVLDTIAEMAKIGMDLNMLRPGIEAAIANTAKLYL